MNITRPSDRFHPGYLLLSKVDYLNYWEEGKILLPRLCHVCHLVKPLRAKHCRIINRCVSGFDHYCPFIYNSVGYRNRYRCGKEIFPAAFKIAFRNPLPFRYVISSSQHCQRHDGSCEPQHLEGNRPYFVGFLTTMCLNSVVGIYLCWNWFNVMGRSIFIGIGFLFLSVIATTSAMMTSLCVYMAAVNLTTAECLKTTKYAYLLDHKGKFFNPFDRGIVLNFMEFLHIIKPLTEEELKKAELTLV
nr:probable palmitoyltransferase ZDHHC12 isoform X1 [Zootoca vivipara]XP_034970105.1 probable palmitoyltransferase ZDHHC12 isoform X1 [Zootoca vivipara]XP_034970106.1 probable palmitoyltransferase ZDHHC12 isoform X1 [Zootoca vivipara]XP_034970107.1 probable palmitoyltransferase ZDHHC12 isoform X1 [Zootoca vivipara]